MERIRNKITKVRLRPIRVYCMHHVCDTFEPSYMYKDDWMSTDEFKYKIVQLKRKGYSFISLRDAYKKIQSDLFRLKKYAVITFDDGYASINGVLQWLQEHRIPVTLFVNIDYADGKSYRTTPDEKYLTRQELESLNVEIGLHGIQHKNANELNECEFNQFVENTVQGTSSIEGYVPFWAYTWGMHTEKTDIVLKNHNLIPVLIDGGTNYNDSNFIHRELLK